jgi:hypothetical protein
MVERDLHLLENQDHRVSQMARVENANEEEDKVAQANRAIANEFRKYLVQARVMPSILPEKIREAGDSLRSYYNVWAFMVSLPPAKLEVVWDIVMLEGE